MRGFTLVELMAIIAVLAILGAVAAPRLLNLQRDSRIAVLQGARASAASASQLAYSVSIARAQAASAPIDMGGVSITMSNHFPTADLAGIYTAAGLDAGVFSTSPGTGAHPPGSVTLVIRISSASSPASCSFFYSLGTAPGSVPLISSPSTAGC